MIKIGKSTDDGIKEGFCNLKGDIVISCEYTSIINIPNRNDLFIAECGSNSKERHYIIINEKGDMIVPLCFQRVEIDVYKYYMGGIAYENLSKSTVQNCDDLIQENIVFKPYNSSHEYTFIYRIGNTYIFATTDNAEIDFLNLKSLDIFVKYVVRGVAIVSYTYEKRKMLGIEAKTYLYDLVDFNNISFANPKYTISADEFERLGKTLDREWLSNATYKIIIDNTLINF